MTPCPLCRKPIQPIVLSGITICSHCRKHWLNKLVVTAPREAETEPGPKGESSEAESE